ncbi:hypothetical protein G6F37_005737 [Rhizopus arrhizus]|nr:hypothetical protein G6F38_007111 [Rhizopus arrhizus]KAG1158497.1 hypothetical protein G6F37_005737 [Rhizopus arrhizus]
MPEEFYINFGYKTNEYGELQFKKAITSVHDSLGEEEDEERKLKVFFYAEFIKNKFQSLKEDYRLDLYWNSTLTESLAVQTHKRRLPFRLNQLAKNANILFVLEIFGNYNMKTRRITNRDENMRNLLTKNAIFDFSNEGGTSQVVLIDDWEHLKAKYHKEYDVPNILVPIKDARITSFQRYQKSLTYQQNARKEECYIYKLISHLAEAYDINPSMFDLSLPEPSEGNLNNKIWDLANVEVGKWPSNTKNKNVHQKILLEAKTIINRILNKYSFINPSSIAVFSLQVCHFKGDLLSSCLGAPKKYFISRVCDRLRVPLSPNISIKSLSC